MNGKTALLKALLNLKNGKNDTIEVFLDIAEKTEDLENLINASYTDPFYKGRSVKSVSCDLCTQITHCQYVNVSKELIVFLGGKEK